MNSGANDIFHGLVIYRSFFRKIAQMHGHKKKKSEWDKKRFKTGMRNKWNVDDDSDMFHANQKRKCRCRLEDANYLEKEDDFEEDDSFHGEYYEEGK